MGMILGSIVIISSILFPLLFIGNTNNSNTNDPTIAASGDDWLFVEGNTIVDAVKRNSDIARKESEILKKHQLREGEYILITMHRPSNVDHPEILTRILNTLVSIPNIT